MESETKEWTQSSPSVELKINIDSPIEGILVK
jgi:hypothetical protein